MKHDFMLDVVPHIFYMLMSNDDNSVIVPETYSYFLKENYKHLSKDFVKKVLDCEIGDNISLYGMDCAYKGFMAGVDTTLVMLRKEPIFGVLEQLGLAGDKDV